VRYRWALGCVLIGMGLLMGQSCCEILVRYKHTLREMPSRGIFAADPQVGLFLLALKTKCE
jgi:hypothetical protein